MTIGASVFLIAVGAILAYAVDINISGVNLDTVGLILMVAGGLGLVISLFLLTSRRNRPVDPGADHEETVTRRL